MAEKFDPGNAHKLEDPQRLVELPPAVVIDLLQLEGAETVVDYGAGTGMYTIPLARALPHGHVVAVDAYAELLQRLRAKLDDGLRSRVQVVHTEADRVPLADGGADRVLLINVLHTSTTSRQRCTKYCACSGPAAS